MGMTCLDSQRNLFAVCGALLICAASAWGQETGKAPPASDGSQAREISPYVLGHRVARIDGEPITLEKYKGKVLLLVNTASRCGLTPQYEGLQTLFETYKERGLVVLGFPANQFGGQEPGTNEQIAEFCSEHYSVTFPMFEKIVVKGKGTHPLYQQLIAQPAPIGGEPRWNFTKFLVDHNGNVIARFEPSVEPQDARLIAKVESLLENSDEEGKPASDTAVRD